METIIRTIIAAVIGAAICIAALPFTAFAGEDAAELYEVARQYLEREDGADYDSWQATVIATGMNVQMALQAARTLAAEGISLRVIDMHTIKPLDREIVLKAARETGAIVTTEEANVMGGLGAAVAEVVCQGCPVPMVLHGVNDQFGRSGAAQSVLDAYGINAEGIAGAVRAVLAKKHG